MIESRRFTFVLFLCTLVGLVNGQHSRGETFNKGQEPYSHQQSNIRSANTDTRQYVPNYNYPSVTSASNYAYSQGQNYNNQQHQAVRPLQQNNNGYGPGYGQNSPVGSQYQQPIHNPSLANRVSNDDPSAYKPQQNLEPLATFRPTKSSTKQTTELPRPTPINRFNNYTTRKLSWDGELSRTTEIFSLKLFAYLEALYNDQNIMIAPFTIHSLLVMISEGANGDTFAQLNNTLGLQTQQRARDFHQYITEILKRTSSDVTLGQFSALIGDRNRPIGLEYENVVEQVFDAEYIPVDFRDVQNTLKLVNDQVNAKTNGQISEAITVDELYKAQLILLSGIHFQGNWKTVFNTTSTRKSPFYDYKQEQQTGFVNMMFQRGPFAYTAIQDIGAYFLELPYGPQTTHNRNNANSQPSADDKGISMIVALPKRGQELYETINKINQFGVERLFKELKNAKEEYDDEEVEVFLPRFETETALNLVEALENMGIKNLFEQSIADLSKINTNYFVSSILHKTKIRVDEKGTEASGIATAFFQNKATPPVFNANRPFLYFIVDRSTRIVLFSGAYKKPSPI